MGLNFGERRGELTEVDSLESEEVGGSDLTEWRVWSRDVAFSVTKDPIWPEVRFSPGAWLPGAGRKQAICFI